MSLRSHGCPGLTGRSASLRPLSEILREVMWPAAEWLAASAPRCAGCRCRSAPARFLRPCPPLRGTPNSLYSGRPVGREQDPPEVLPGAVPPTTAHTSRQTELRADSTATLRAFP